MPTLVFSDVQLFIAIKLCLILFVLCGLCALYGRMRPWIFFAATGVLSAIAYALLVADLGLLFWGLQGDEVTIAAMYTTFARVGLLSDFGYHGLPPFYPPLFFWVFGLIGRFMEWNGVLIAKVATFVSFLFVPLAIYWVTRVFGRKIGTISSDGAIAAICAPFLLFIFIDVDSVIGKPYELIAAVAIVLWTLFLLRAVHGGGWRWRQSALFGVVGGLIFMTYYLWLVFAALAIALAGLWVARQDQWTFYRRLLGVAAWTLIVSAPYLVPLVITYLRLGTENWQAALFTVKSIQWNSDLFLPLAWRSALMLFGLVVLVAYRAIPHMRSLLFLFVAPYVWWAMGLLTLFFFETTMQEFRGFYFFQRTVLALAAAFGIEYLWGGITRYRQGFWSVPLKVAGLLFVGTSLIFGSFIDDPLVQERRVKSRQLRGEIVALRDFLIQRTHMTHTLTVQSSIPELAAFVPINNFIYFNQHNSHPAAHFSMRRAYLVTLASARNAEEFYRLASATPYGPIDRFILFRDGGRYKIFLHRDAPLQGIQEEVIEIPRALITPDYFALVYERDNFVVWERRREGERV